jgi:membrane-associated protease RseP (regulator of RpoE activity)
MIVFLTQLFAFVFVLSIVVTVHELGHFWAARACGVAIDCFSIGFGPKIVAWRDKTGVEWRIASIPLGGYVRFSGDDNAASVPDGSDLAILKQEIAAREGEAAVSRYYHFKPVWQRAIIAVAGPVANFLLAIAVLAVFMATIGEIRNPARRHGVGPGSAAEAAGFKPGDVILKADGRKIETFQDLNGYVALRAKLPIDFTVKRGGDDPPDGRPPRGRGRGQDQRPHEDRPAGHRGPQHPYPLSLARLARHSRRDRRGLGPDQHDRLLSGTSGHGPDLARPDQRRDRHRPHGRRRGQGQHRRRAQCSRRCCCASSSA